MLRELKTAFLALLALGVLTGVVYPLALTLLAQLAFPRAANGSLVVVDGVVRGSALVGQDWRGDRWFHGRPSATVPAPYATLPSGGSNLGPTNPALASAIGARAAELRAQGVAGPLPVELLTSSASGLDPHVSPAGARAQVERVARARGLDPARVRALVEAHVEGRILGVLGEPRVNVLALDLALATLP
jgi:potassium-transporting ATPase KdpC subunit